ncbi:MarR family transcriptional regulator [Enemella dayhoffiae]|uniref:MarR family transcriptional regulator n=1 Tax=Enemella dayhoffiae TaxID=2016507 RepID=A0A255H3A9_9ACTN|nr:MarR family winged helix-turn-helix transcriptional regulator [Enemella dayhoffiae]OYO22160.1 MarR family transcriptional regulator [Enemella dayhoffiae]
MEASPPQRLLNTPTWLITHVATVAARLSRQAFASVDAGRYEYALLCALAEFGPCSQAELGTRLGIDKKDVAERTRSLIEERSATRSEDPADSRRNLIALTEQGMQRLGEIEKAVDSAQAELLQDLTGTEASQLNEMLRRLL